MPIGKFFTSAGNFLEDFGKKIKSLDMEVSLEDLLGNYGDALDKIIVREERDQKCTYIGGELKISALDDKNYDCAYALYFEDANESVHAVESKSKPLEMKFLTEDFRQKLRKDGVLKFEIDEPSEEARAKYNAPKS